MANTTRRAVLLAAGVATVGSARAAEMRAWDFSFPSLEDGVLNLADLSGRVLLVVNTASFCGYTYQYEGLQKMHATLAARGLTVVGFPSQDFNQEKDSNGEVKAFCEATFGVTFPMAGLSHVRGPEANAFYKWVRAHENWEPDWNFNKVLIGRDGGIAGHFPSTEEPDGRVLSTAVARQLAVVG
jgi:glutathione peroxidase